MGEIIRERNCQQKNSGGKIFLFIIGVVVFINTAVVIINKFTPLAAGMASIILVLSVMGIAYRIMTGKISEYYYTLTDKALLFHRAMGIREIKLMKIPYDRILDIKPDADYDGNIKMYYFLCNKKDHRRRVLVFNQGQKAEGIVFCPSREFIDALKERTKKA
jgi:hypothetical protein